MIYKEEFNYLVDTDKTVDIDKDKTHQFCLQPLKQVYERQTKLILEEFDPIFKTSFPILGDPFVFIEINFLGQESKIYEFELFKFSRSLNKKIKY